MFLDEPLRIPYFFSTGPVTRPSTALLFRSRQTMPPLRTVVAIAPNTDVAGLFESRRGVQLDGVAIRLEDPTSAHSELTKRGVERIVDDTEFWRQHRVTLQDPLEIEARSTAQQRTTRRLVAGWTLLLGGLGGVVYFADGPSWPWAVVCGVVAAIGGLLSRVGS